MWPKRRVLKKDQKQYTKKQILFFSLLSGVLGVVLILAGMIVLSKEPIFTSPLPLLRPFGGSSEKDESKQQIEKFVKEEQLSVKEIQQVSKTVYKLKLEENGEVLLTSERDISEQLASLQRIVSRLTMEGKKFKRLDLRYDKPVIELQ